jgi:ribosomal-protein-alanine N-acetyltransferase
MERDRRATKMEKPESKSIVCESLRLILRRFDENDAEAILKFRGDPQVMQFSLTGPESREDIRIKYLPSCVKRYARDGFGQWAVIRKSDGNCIGECGICAQIVDGSREYEISYRLRRDCWGQGLATEAAQACRDYGFEQIGLTRMISIIEPENAASIRVAEKMGMTLEKRASFHDIAAQIYGITHAAAGSA